MRQVIHDHMEKCMLGSDYHMEFAVSALELGTCEAKIEQKLTGGKPNRSAMLCSTPALPASATPSSALERAVCGRASCR